jgi:L-histidine N-alpha-methyltransferase
VTEPTYLDHLPADFEAAELRADVLAGLSTRPRWLAPRWFYDKVGSELFEEITRLPEYYPTRTERGILAEQAAEIVRRAGCDTVLELGSGASEKTRLLLDALIAAHAAGSGVTGATGPADPTGSGRRPGYVALDVSETALLEASAALAEDYPGLSVTALRADFTGQLHLLPGRDGEWGRRMVTFLGSTIGNFEPGPRAAFLTELRSALRPGEGFLLGADLVKPADVLVPAYDDAAGVTAAFNRNVLEVLNARLGADFDPAAFEHRAVWHPGQAWIEMRLRSRAAQRIRLADLDLEVDLAAGEEIRTEISAKFRRPELTAELLAAGFAPSGWWTDPRGYFSLSLWRAT